MTPIKINHIDFSVGTVRVASDLHLEQYRTMNIIEQVDIVLPPHENDSNSVLVLAGDISSRILELIQILEYVSTKFKYVIYVPGNHEYYGYTRQNWDIDLVNSTKHLPNVFSGGLNTQVLNFNNARFIANTMWADGGKSAFDQANIQRGLRDFYVIGEGQDYPNDTVEDLFTVSNMVDLNKAHIESFKRVLSNKISQPTIMVTHHMPLYELCHPRFGDRINGGFACDGSALIDEFGPNVWIFGHTHDTIERQISNTLFISNPCGYRNERQYDPSFTANNNYGYFTLGIK